MICYYFSGIILYPLSHTLFPHLSKKIGGKSQKLIQLVTSMGKLESGRKKREMRTGGKKVKSILLSTLIIEVTINTILCFIYPNNNQNQPGCEKNPKWNTKK